MTDIPKIVPIDLSKSLMTASKSHTQLGYTIAEHAAKAADTRRMEHDKLAADNQLLDIPKAVPQ